MPLDLRKLVNKAQEIFLAIGLIKLKHTDISNRISYFALTSKILVAVLLMNGIIFNIAMLYLFNKH